jgi:diguanylate cyclase (GGDEF)-like protein/PAS domain S-box-containing protein
MIKLTPTVRISLGLILSVISLLIFTDMVGLIPDRSTAVIEGRKQLAESLTIQYSLAAQKHDYDSIATSMRALVERNEEVLSAALELSDGRTLATAGDHATHWAGFKNNKSTPTHIQVPISRGSEQWGRVELSFAPLHQKSVLGFHLDPLVVMATFIGVCGFLVFLVIIRKTLEQLDPSSVVPARVKYALDALAEGVLLLDNKNRIILANAAFSKSVGRAEKTLIGKKASALNFESPPEQAGEDLPWEQSARLGLPQTGNQLRMRGTTGETRTFMVNSAPIIDETGEGRGVMATFDDVTQLEAKNDQLQNMLGLLEKSRDEVDRQNQKLQILATRDPLTDCLNRRSFFDTYEPQFEAARTSGEPLACIMGDIDFFKSINDNYGHGKGDEVIQQVAKALQSAVRSTDAVCRYGGEEFCVILPGSSIEQARKTAERARTSIEALRFDNPQQGGEAIRITSSFGAASIEVGAADLAALVDQADRALYLSKEGGRNRVTLWSQALEDTDPEAKPPAPEAASEPEAKPATVVTLEPEREQDTLTGLPNRTRFHERITAAIETSQETGQCAAVMIIDFDLFKRVNNALGYAIGDELLRALATRLTDTLRSTDAVSRFELGQETSTLYRMGGDEFGILLTELEDSEVIDPIVKRLIEAVTTRIDIAGHEIHLTASIGISQIPDNGEEADTLLKNAGVALHYAKCQGRNTYQFYDETLNRTSFRDLIFENDLRHAIEADAFELHYQPKVDLGSGRICGMEALIRWHHPEMGLIHPYEFIPLAEDSGLIVPIGYWVMRAACAQIKSWQQAGYENIRVAINLSAIQFRQQDLLEQIHAILDQSGVAPNALELEITESTIMANLDAAAATMQALSETGLRIAIDDFGTGYSSLTHLKRFPISTIKVDRSFVSDISTDPDDAAIVSAIIAMAHSMGLRVIAEGVETAEQLNYLRQLHCDEIQGYLFSRPLTVAAANDLLKASQTTEEVVQESRNAS